MANDIHPTPGVLVASAFMAQAPDAKDVAALYQRSRASLERPEERARFDLQIINGSHKLATELGIVARLSAALENDELAGRARAGHDALMRLYTAITQTPADGPAFAGSSQRLHVSDRELAHLTEALNGFHLEMCHLPDSLATPLYETLWKLGNSLGGHNLQQGPEAEKLRDELTKFKAALASLDDARKVFLARAANTIQEEQ